MAEDDDISRRYRELPREEPPRQLDDAIRAAARRAAHTRPAPLVVPTGRQRWYFPLAAAAIIVLAVAVTMHVDREQPGEEIVSAPAAPQPEHRRKTESADSRELRDTAPPRELQKAQEPSAASPAPAEAPPPVATQDAPAARSESARAPATSQANAQLGRADEGRRAGSLSAFSVQSPEQWLQGIDDLKRQGRHEEAERELAEFRKRYPNYRIPEAITEKFERR